MAEEYRQIQGEIKLLESDNDFLFPVEIWLLNDKVNRNNWQFVNLEKHRELWAGIPILVAYVNNGMTTGDGHNQQTRRDRNGEPYQSFVAADAERICGAMSDEISDIRLEERDGALWTVGRGSLWAWYCHELCLQIADWALQGQTMSVSIEALVTESHMEGNVEVEESYIPLGVTLLGRGVAPAVDGAHIAMLTEMEDEFKELKLRAASYIHDNAENNKPQKNTNKGVKTQMYLSKQQLKELQKKFGDNYAVLCAKQSDEGIKVLLMRHDNHIFCTYTIGEKDSAFDEGRVAECAAQITVKLAEDDELCADAAECIAAETAVADAKCAKVDALEKELSAKDETIKTMQEQESKRRLSAAKEAATRALSDFNAAREDVIADDILKAVNADIDAGMYACCANADGEWTGASAVTERVLALCAQEQMKLDKASAMRKKGTHIMDRLSHNAADDGTVQGLLARKGIN